MKLPDKPGVYFFKKGREVLYVGKATSLKSRVASYFSGVPRSTLIEKMVKESTKVDFEQTDSALEALILEAQYIKKYQPAYNSKEKDNKSFNYVVITDEDIPRVIVVRSRELEKKRSLEVKYQFGPFPSGGSLNESLRIIRKIFPFLDGKVNKNNKTFYKQLGLVPENFDREYKRNINNVKLFFEGKKKKILNSLEKEMKDLAKKERFEEASRVKKQIFAINHIKDVSLIDESFVKDIKSTEGFRIESYDVAHTSGKEVVGVMTVLSDGAPDKNQYRKFNLKEGNNDIRALSEILERRLAHDEWPLPRLIVVDGGRAQKNIMEKILEKHGVFIPVVAVTKDEKHRPLKILGKTEHQKEVLLANNESHRFAVSFHRKRRGNCTLIKRSLHTS
ncbi:MAG: UvrB/UvrC motif-containing protein [Candidatus Pacebacteria bacterium]|nr:UvrB/UvrC motif-containing protein [Candidatus Paceibacterota bacterium]